MERERLVDGGEMIVVLRRDDHVVSVHGLVAVETDVGSRVGGVQFGGCCAETLLSESSSILTCILS